LIQAVLIPDRKRLGAVSDIVETVIELLAGNGGWSRKNLWPTDDLTKRIVNVTPARQPKAAWQSEKTTKGRGLTLFQVGNSVWVSEQFSSKSDYKGAAGTF
jgi:hypothetical protein